MKPLKAKADKLILVESFFSDYFPFCLVCVHTMSRLLDVIGIDCGRSEQDSFHAFPSIFPVVWAHGPCRNFACQAQVNKFDSTITKQSGFNNITWDSSSFGWQINYPTFNEKAQVTGSKTRLFPVFKPLFGTNARFCHVFL